MKKPYLVIASIIGIFAIGISAILHEQITQNCMSEGGGMTGFLTCTKVYRDFASPTTRSDYKHMVELFQKKYESLGGGIMDRMDGARLELVASNRYGDSITLALEENRSGMYTEIICNHKTLGKIERVTENIVDYLQNKNCLIPTLDVKRPFPRELTMWGKEAISFAQAKIDSGITQMILPSYVPANLKPESVRVITSPISNSTTVIYTPLGVTATDSDTFEKVMSDGGMFVVYTKEKVGSTYDQRKWVEQFVNEAPTVRYLLTINGHTAISVKGAPEKDVPSEVWILYDQPAKDVVIQTMLVSLVQSNAELEKIAKSLTD